jgi:hypothetical protein
MKERTGAILLIAIGIKVLLIGLAYVLPFSVLGLFGVESAGHAVLINYAPEVWLSLLALVFGTLIIVVSIAAENTPKLIDLFIGDPKGRLYIWLIMVSSLENIYLQVFSAQPGDFVSNVIFINNYVLLPVFVLLAIPYTFYILRYTKSANVIEHIYQENVEAMMSARFITAERFESNHKIIFETVNQLHDLLQYVQFKEPKGDIINRLGNSARLYLKLKSRFPAGYFKLNNQIRNDISFRTLTEKYAQIEGERTFYEQKILKVMGTTYLHLINEGHYELASLCGNELLEIGKAASNAKDKYAVDAVIIHFNTFMRYGINQGIRDREIRNIYNIIFHYSELVDVFIDRREEERILQCCNYLSIYGNEAVKISQSEPLFSFLVDIISWELKKMLVLLHEKKFSRQLQKSVLGKLTNLRSGESQPFKHVKDGGVRLIQIALSLYYLDKDEIEFNEAVMESIIRDLNGMSIKEARNIILNDCSRLDDEKEDFWEETDQGNRNIFYSREKKELQKFMDSIFAKLGSLQPIA